MLATTTLRAPGAGGHHDHNHDGANNNDTNNHNVPPASPSPAGVLRVGREIENIGERVPLSKKRITWRFVFADSEQVHTVTLEHSRISAKKRLRLDGRRLFTSEQYCPGDWRYEFQAAKTHAARFCVAIKDVKATVVEERRLDSIYELFVDGRAWDQLEDRKLAAAATSSVWSSELYARRVVEEKRVLTRAADAGDNNSHAVAAHCVAWTFAFGLHGTIHKLELRDLDRGDDGGEFVVILDSRLLTRVNHDDIEEDVWEYAYTLFEQHTLSVVVTLESEGKKYECFIDGCAWKDLGETDFVLQTGWFPVYSRSRGTSYFRNEATGVSQWDRPIMSRDGVAIEVPRRQSTLALPPPSDRFDADGLVRLSNGYDAHVPEPPSNQHDNNVHQYQSGGLTSSSSATNAPFTKKEDSANLLDFSEMSVHVSPTAQLSSSIDAFDPFAHIAAQPPAPSSVKQQQQPARRSSQPPPVDLLS